MLFTLAICGLHFTAMAAAGVYPDPTLEVPAEAIDSATLTVAVVAMATIILSISFIMVLFDRKLAYQAAEEAQRIRAFADAAIEGLVVVDGERVVDANRSFLRLAGYGSAQQLPEKLHACSRASTRFQAGVDAKATECRLVTAEGDECDVEVLLRRSTGAAPSGACSPSATSASARKPPPASPTSPITTP